MRWLAVALVFVMLPGCNGSAPGDAGSQASAPDQNLAGVRTEAGPIAFAAPAFNSTLPYQVEFAITDACVIGFLPGDCATAYRRIDLTPQVPAGPPVELTVTSRSNALVNLNLELADASFTRYTNDGGSLAASILRGPAGTVTLVVQIQSLTTRDSPDPTPVDLEVRTVVRPEVLPSFLPVAISLAAGDQIEAQGSGIEDFVVVPPSGVAVHHLTNFSYVVPDDVGKGRHVVVLIGQGDGALFGPNVTMEPLVVQFMAGTPRPVAAGREVTWEFTVAGVPLYVGIGMQSQGTGPVEATVNIAGNYALTITQENVLLLEGGRNGCTGPCGSISFGNAQTSYYTPYFPENLTAGTFSATAFYEIQGNLEVYEFAAWVEP